MNPATPPSSISAAISHCFAHCRTARILPAALLCITSVILHLSTRHQDPPPWSCAIMQQFSMCNWQATMLPPNQTCGARKTPLITLKKSKPESQEKSECRLPKPGGPSGHSGQLQFVHYSVTAPRGLLQ